MLASLVGLSLVVASGCAINNCIDRDIDAKMQRTCKRVTVTGEIAVGNVLAFGLALGVLGFNYLSLVYQCISPAICCYWLHSICGGL